MGRLLKSFFLLLLVLTTFQSWTENNQRVIPLSSGIYIDMEILYLEQGLASPSSAKPWSAAEALQLLNKINPDDISPQGSLLYKEIKNEIKITPIINENGIFKVDIGLDVNLESYLRKNREDTDWIHGYEKRLPLLNIPFELFLYDNFYVDIEFTFKEEYRAISTDSNNYTNFPSALTSLDWYFPFRTFFAFGGEHWNLQFGREQMSWGNGVTGNLLLSDYTDFYNILKVSTWWKAFKFTSVYISLEPWLMPAENPISGWYTDFGELYKAFTAHRFEFRIFDKATFAITESVVMGNKYPELSDFNFLMLYHNWQIPERANSLISIELELNPWKYFSIYGQFALDDFQTSYEVETGTGGRPGATGLLAGLEGVLPIAVGYLTGGFEFVKTDPWLYNRWHTLTKFTSRRRIWSYVPPDSYHYIDKPLGYIHGSDTINYFVYLNYRFSGRFYIGLDFSYLILGENNIDIEYTTGLEAQELSTPCGIPETNLIFHANAEYVFFPGLSVGTDFYWINTVNSNHVEDLGNTDFEWIISVKYAL